MDWLSLVLAGLFEMIGVIMISKANKAHSLKAYAILLSSFALSFLFLSFAMKTLPMGTAYAVWTGIGVAGGALAGIFLYNESKNPLRILAIFMVLGSAIGLKLMS